MMKFWKIKNKGDKMIVVGDYGNGNDEFDFVMKFTVMTKCNCADHVTYASVDPVRSIMKMEGDNDDFDNREIIVRLNGFHESFAIADIRPFNVYLDNKVDSERIRNMSVMMIVWNYIDFGSSRYMHVVLNGGMQEGTVYALESMKLYDLYDRHLKLTNGRFNMVYNDFGNYLEKHGYRIIGYYDVYD